VLGATPHSAVSPTATSLIRAVAAGAPPVILKILDASIEHYCVPLVLMPQTLLLFVATLL
jgi:hypothetical protein